MVAQFREQGGEEASEQRAGGILLNRPVDVLLYSAERVVVAVESEQLHAGEPEGVEGTAVTPKAKGRIDPPLCLGEPSVQKCQGGLEGMGEPLLSWLAELLGDIKGPPERSAALRKSTQP
jgi:hypothetical protein